MRRRLRELEQGEPFRLRFLLYCAKGRTPTGISHKLDCSRSKVYRLTDAYLTGKLPYSVAKLSPADQPARRSRLAPWLSRLLAAAPPH